ncbi:unnamed protein product [Caenorhabditis brenneri]
MMSKENSKKKNETELRLNVESFYNNEETRNLILAEEAARIFNQDSNIHDNSGERVYECVIGSSAWRITRSSLLALSLFFTIAVAVIVIAIVLLCTFITLSSSTEMPDDVSNEDIIGVINWLHYPIGDLALRRVNYSRPHHR